MNTWEQVQDKIRRPGETILTRWKNEREGKRIQNSGVPLSEVAYGSELYQWLTGGINAAGVVVNERSAMSVSAVYGCVNLIGGAISSIPLPIYQRTDAGRELAKHDLWWLLNEQPHERWSAAAFWEFIAGSLLLNGDAFARIIRAAPLSPVIVGFEPIHKSRVTPFISDGRLAYRVGPDPVDVSNSKTLVIDQADMLHVPGPGFNGLVGMSQIAHVLRNPAGIAIAADEYSAAFFGNGARPDFALEVPGTLSKEQQEMIRDTWSSRHGGVRNAHLPALLAGGIKVHELTMNAEDAQLIATRQFQVEDIARIFGVPPHMIGHTDKSTSWGSGIEAMGIGFVKYTLQRHLVKIEQEINRKCFRTAKYYAEFNTAGLERGDTKTRNDSYRTALGRAGEPGWMTVNEVRRLENLPPAEDGDTLNKGSTPNEQVSATSGG